MYHWIAYSVLKGGRSTKEVEDFAARVFNARKKKGRNPQDSWQSQGDVSQREESKHDQDSTEETGQGGTRNGLQEMGWHSGATIYQLASQITSTIWSTTEAVIILFFIR